jgi:hypothetical protein
MKPKRLSRLFRRNATCHEWLLYEAIMNWPGPDGVKLSLAVMRTLGNKWELGLRDNGWERQRKLALSMYATPTQQVKP